MHVELEIDVGDGHLRGTARCGSAREVAFEGWLHLAVIVDAALADDADVAAAALARASSSPPSTRMRIAPHHPGMTQEGQMSRAS